MRARYLALLVACFSILSANGVAAQGAPPTAAGLWQQIDDVSGQSQGWFLIYENNGVYEGAIAKMFIKPGDNPNPICSKCQGDQKNAPSLGLTIIKRMQRNGLKYQDGTILDPRDGNVYNALMELSPNGQTLTVRGYLGIALFGRNQVWQRLPAAALAQVDCSVIAAHAAVLPPAAAAGCRPATVPLPPRRPASRGEVR
jgi:uncharacterized protein (DUF2147 family)